MNIRRNSALVLAGIVVGICIFALPGIAQEKQEKKDFSYAVGPGAVISITNNYGRITVKPSGSSQVVVETVSHSDAVSLVNEQHGDRIELRSMSSRQGTNLVDYTVLVPAAAFVTLRSSDGTLRVQGLRGDVVLEAASGSVEVRDISDAHLHVKTFSGPISLTDIRNSRLDVHSVSGDGNLQVSIPASAWVEIKARSIKSQSDPDFPNLSRVPAIGQTSLLGKPGKMLGSRFELRSFSGKIHLKRP